MRFDSHTFVPGAQFSRIGSLNILIFGGSFDPPHLGHCALLNAAARRLDPDRILLVPAWQSPFKGAARAAPSARLAMIRLGIVRRLPPPLRRLCRIDRSELNLRRRVYTVETLRRLKKLHPGAELHFLTGTDSSAQFQSWKRPDELRRLARWYCGRRPGAGRPARGFKILPGKFPEISSTEIRGRLALGEGASPLLDKKVLVYIKKNGIYGTELFETLRRQLPAERLYHSQKVAGLAAELAARHSLNPDRARLAGLLHDAGRAIPVDRMAAYALRHGIDAPRRSEIILHNPLLLHAYIGAELARSRLGVRDEQVLSAIRSHTLGALKMSPLDRLLYIADCCSEDRSYPGAGAMRALARRDLKAAFKACVGEKISHAANSGGWMHPLTKKLWKSIPS